MRYFLVELPDYADAQVRFDVRDAAQRACPDATVTEAFSIEHGGDHAGDVQLYAVEKRVPPDRSSHDEPRPPRNGLPHWARHRTTPIARG